MQLKFKEHCGVFAAEQPSPLASLPAMPHGGARGHDGGPRHEFAPGDGCATRHSSGARYCLGKGLGVWQLTFDGAEALLKHERGIFYVAWLLAHPPEQPLHALDLAAKIAEIYRRQLGLVRIVDPGSGQAVPLLSHARLQERSLALDDAESMRALLRKERELEAILDDECETEPVKREALRELEAIAEFQQRHGRQSCDNARRAVRAVRMAVMRFHRRLQASLTRDGGAHPVLRPFADHLEKYLVIPSARCRAGCFVYEPPQGVLWADENYRSSVAREKAGYRS